MICCVLCSLWFWAALVLAAALYGAYLINPFPGGYRKPSRSPVPAGSQIEFTVRFILFAFCKTHEELERLTIRRDASSPARTPPLVRCLERTLLPLLRKCMRQ